MEVILTEKIKKLGNLGDLVKIKRGYGRNYLIPSGKAIPATAENKLEFQARLAELEKKQQETIATSMERAKTINNLYVEIAYQVSETGKLYGSVSATDIITAVALKDVTLQKSEIILPAEHIRQLGDYEVEIRLHADVTANLKISVVAKSDS